MKIMVLLWSTSVVKRIVALSLLSFSVIFPFFGLSLFFLFGLSFFGLSLFFSLFYLVGSLASFFLSPKSHPDLWGNHSLHHPFLTWDNSLIMKIITLLLIYNSTLRTKYDSIWMPLAVYRDMQWIKSDMYENYEGGLATNTMSTTWLCKEQDVNDGACHNNGTVESCMAIYLGMAMEMPW